MSRLIDLIGQKFGTLTVVSRADNSKTGSTRWLCRCECGNETIVFSRHLRDGNSKSCGSCQKKVPHNYEDLTGKRFGLLIVISRAVNSSSGHVKWLCRCDCGKNTTAFAINLRRGHTKSCGCLRHDQAHNFIDIKGKRYGRLVVISREKNTKGGSTRWICICDCGNEKIVEASNLALGITKSCGCYKSDMIRKTHTKHGYTKRDDRHPLYNTWNHIIDRTENENSNSWKDYGGRGIKMCKRWRKSFPQFLKDMGEKPSIKHSIDRIDNDGNYEPNNCRWATIKEQHNNTRKNVYAEIDGVSKTMAQWCRFYNINYATAHSRIKKGWPIKLAFTAPPFFRYRKKKKH